MFRVALLILLPQTLPMNKTEVKKILRRHKRLGVRPWSFYQMAQMLGVNRARITMLFNRDIKSRPLMARIERLLGNGANLSGEIDR